MIKIETESNKPRTEEEENEYINKLFEEVQQLKSLICEKENENEVLDSQLKKSNARVRIHIKETSEMKKERKDEKEEMDMILIQYQKAEETINDLAEENERLKKFPHNQNNK